jgi:hypothetical protein
MAAQRRPVVASNLRGPIKTPTIERRPWRCLAAPAMNSQGRVGRTDPAAWPGIAIVDQFDLRLP